MALKRSEGELEAVGALAGRLGSSFFALIRDMNMVASPFLGFKTKKE